MGAGVQQPQMQQPGMSGKGSSQQQMPQQGYGGKGGQQQQQMQLLQQRQQMPQQGYGGKGGQQLAPDQLQQLQAQMGNFSAPPAQQPMRQQPMPNGNFTPGMSRDAFAQEYFGNNMTVGAPSFANQQVDAAYDRFQQQTPMQQVPLPAGQIGKPAQMLAQLQFDAQNIPPAQRPPLASMPRLPFAPAQRPPLAQAGRSSKGAVPPTRTPRPEAKPMPTPQPTIPAGAQIGRREPMQPALQPSKNNSAMRGLGIGALLGRGLR